MNPRSVGNLNVDLVVKSENFMVLKLSVPVVTSTFGKTVHQDVKMLIRKKIGLDLNDRNYFFNMLRWSNQ